MVSIININNGIKEPSTRGDQNCITSQILLFGGYLKVRDIWANTIIKHIDTRGDYI